MPAELEVDPCPLPPCLGIVRESGLSSQLVATVSDSGSQEHPQGLPRGLLTQMEVWNRECWLEQKVSSHIVPAVKLKASLCTRIADELFWALYLPSFPLSCLPCCHGGICPAAEDEMQAKAVTACQEVAPFARESRVAVSLGLLALGTLCLSSPLSRFWMMVSQVRSK